MRAARRAVLRDPQIWAAFAAALPVWAALVWWRGTPSPGWVLRDPLTFLLLALVYPVLEELVFRGLVQGELLKRWTARAGPLSAANVVTSALFAALHVVMRPTWLAAATFPVSLVFGYFRERHGSVLSPIVLHVVYNAGFLVLVRHG